MAKTVKSTESIMVKELRKNIDDVLQERMDAKSLLIKFADGTNLTIGNHESILYDNEQEGYLVRYNQIDLTVMEKIYYNLDYVVSFNVISSHEKVN